jgi:hypothetical protein
MNFRLRLVWILGAMWLGNSPSAFGQTPDSQDLEKRSRSHFPIRIEGDFSALRNRVKLHDETLKKDQLPKDFEQLGQELLKNPKDANAQKKLDELAKNPLLKDWLQQELNSQKEQLNSQKDKLPPEQFQKLEEQVRKLEDVSKSGPLGESPGGPGGGREKMEGRTPSGPKADEGQISPPPFMGKQPPMPSTPPAEQSTPEQQLRHWIVDNFNPNKGPLADSPAFQDLLRELRRTPVSTEPPEADDNSLAGRFARWSESLAKSEAWSKVDWPSLKKWRLPSTRSLPKVQAPFSAPSFARTPNISLPPASAIDRGLQLLWAVLVVVAGILVWRLLGGYVPGTGRSARRSWRLGPWPVAPGAVASRQDVIQAFEYLSLLSLGPTAQSRNHLDLAAELGQTALDRRRSADRLAAVYEQARYTPKDEPISADALAAARNELCFLAGVKGA